MILFSIKFVSKIFLIERRIEHDIINVHSLLFLRDFNETRIWTDFRKKIELSNFMKIRPVGAADTQTDGQTLRS